MGTCFHNNECCQTNFSGVDATKYKALAGCKDIQVQDHSRPLSSAVVTSLPHPCHLACLASLPQPSRFPPNKPLKGHFRNTQEYPTS